MADTANVRVLKAIKAGAQTIPAIAKAANCPASHVGVSIVQLQKMRYLLNEAGKYTVTKTGAASLAPPAEPDKPAKTEDEPDKPAKTPRSGKGKGSRGK